MLFGFLIGSSQSAIAWEVVGDTRSAAIRVSSTDVRFGSEAIPRIEAWFAVSCKRDDDGDVLLTPRIDVRIPLNSSLRRQNINRISDALVIGDHTALSIDSQSRSIQGSRYGLFTVTSVSGGETDFEQSLANLVSSLGDNTEFILTSRGQSERDSIRIFFETEDSQVQFARFETLCDQTT